MKKSRNEDRFIENYVTGSALNQMSSKVGMRKYGDKVVQALLIEFMKLEDEYAFMPVDSTKLTRQ